ncbi:MAG: cyclic pyranopterin monophosphate synthase MoaC [Candidatus Tyrphobacter sp.]
MPKPSHFSRDGAVTMVDVSSKRATRRVARAEAVVCMGAAAFRALREATLAKGDALMTAQIAGIAAAKRTDELIPLAHALPLGSIDVRFEWKPPNRLRIEAEARTNARTGVELEALVAATVAALTIYDMTKALDKGIAIERVALLEKRGGKSGTWRRR